MNLRFLNRVKDAYYLFRDRHGNALRIVCAVRGHDYPAMLVPACCLYTCGRCGRELLGRTISKEEFDKLAPMTDEIREAIDAFDEYDRQEADHA